MGRLLDVLWVELLDQARLDGGAAGGEVGGVDCCRGGGRGEDACGLGEEGAEVGGDAWGVGCAAAEDDFVGVEDVQVGFADCFFDQVSEGGEGFQGEHLVASAVDCAAEIEAIRQGFNGETSGLADAESAFGGFGFESQLSETAWLFAWVGGVFVLFEEFFGEVVDQEGV